MTATFTDQTFSPSIGLETINYATSTTPVYTVVPTAKHSFSVQYPWQGSGPDAFVIESASDHHALIEAPGCNFYELYHTAWNNNTQTLSADSGYMWNVNDGFVPLPIGSDTPSALSSGISLGIGILKYSDYVGNLPHPLLVTVPRFSLCTTTYIQPADDTNIATYAGQSPCMPWGAHIRLKASFPDTGHGAQAKFIIDTLQTYGAYIADEGSASGNTVLYMDDGNSGEGTWNSSQLNAAMGANMTWADFDVMPIGTRHDV